MTRRVDGAIIAGVARVAHGLQRWTGVISYQLSKWSMYWLCVSVILITAVRWSDVFAVLPNDPIVTALNPLVFVLQAWRFPIFDRVIRQWRSDPTVKLIEIRFLQWPVWLRVTFIPVGCFEVLYAFRVAGASVPVLGLFVMQTVPILLSGYFIEVDPLPPGESKIGAFIRSLVPSGMTPAAVRR
jgi:hypothetical protein